MKILTHVFADRVLLRIIGVYLATGGWSGLAFQYIERLPALQEVLFAPADKFSIPTYAYWALLSASLLAAVAAGLIITRLAGWHRGPRISWCRYLLAAVLVATSVPFQAWLFRTKWEVNGEITTFTPIDVDVIAATAIIAVLVYALDQYLGAQWGSRLAGSLLVIAILAALPIGVVALLMTLAACVITGRIQIGFSVLLVLAGVAVLFVSAFFGLVLGIAAMWPIAVASASALFGYRVHRTTHKSFGMLLDHIFPERILENAD